MLTKEEMERIDRLASEEAERWAKRERHYAPNPLDDDDDDEDWD